MPAPQSRGAKRVKISDQSDGEFLNSWTKADGEQPEDEGRMYGSGLSSKDQEMLDIVDQAEDFNSKDPKSYILKFEKTSKKNQLLRSKYPDDPIKYADSEADLAECIHALQTIISPAVLPLTIMTNNHITLLSLLAHENTDIAIACVQLLEELTDEDKVESTSETAYENINAFVKELVKNDCLTLVVSNLSRLDDDKEDDKQGIYNTLSLIENILSIDPSIAERINSETKLLTWLLARISVKNFDSVRQYSSELLEILVQNSPKIGQSLGEMGAIDTLLQVLARYRKKDAALGEEVEMVENIFNVMCLILSEPVNQSKFMEAEGLELMLLMIKERKMARMRAVKVIDHALTGKTTESCQHFIDVMGLGTLLSLLMQKGLKKYKKAYHDFSQTHDLGEI